MTSPTTSRPEPIRRCLVRAFESAKDIGDPELIALARGVWWAFSFPGTRPCHAADMEVFRDWCTA